MLLIRIGPDPAFDLGADPEAKPMRIQADQDPGQTFESQKVEFLHEKYTYLK